MTESTKEIQEFHDTSAAMMVFNPQMMEAVEKLAKMMANGKTTIPVHLQKNESDCAAVAMQAIQWKMNPFVVAQKTHVTQGGLLGYEAQLINAVATTSGALSSQPNFEFFGNWDRILGRISERTGQSGGKYYVADWKKEDEEGLGVICTATLRGESEPRSITVMLSQCYPRFSTQWATDPQQQICFASVRKFCRRHSPAAILGVYAIEELDEIELNPPPRATGNIASTVIDAEPETITEDQLKDLMGRLASANIPVESFCKKLRINRLHELQAARYDPAIKLIDAFVKSQAEAAQQTENAEAEAQ